MSFLVDPPWLAANGYLIGRTLPNRKMQTAAEVATLAAFIGTSVALYRNEEWTRPLWEACKAESGRDWMLNSGVTAFEHERPSESTNRLAAAIFALYPVFLRWGVERGRKHGRKQRRGRSGW